MSLNSVWVVYSVGEFVGYSESLGNGRENKELIAIFSTKDRALNFIAVNSDYYSRQDDKLIYAETKLDLDLDLSSKKISPKDYFKKHRDRYSRS